MSSQTNSEKISHTEFQTDHAKKLSKHGGVRTGEEENEQLVIPKNRITIVFIGLMLTVFLAALDQTIVCNYPLYYSVLIFATALPTIVHDLKGAQNYSWVGSAYLLASAAFTPIYGRVSDIIGRKPILYGCIVIFLIGSALCGAAQSMLWLILARALEGVGAGGILSMVMIVIGDIISLEERGLYTGYISAVWALATVVGPILGGALSQHASWRWCFYINLPTGGCGFVILIIFLNLNPPKQVKVSELILDFDWVGLFLFVSGVVLFLTGLASGGNGMYNWTSPVVLGTLIPGIICLILATINELYTKRNALFPPRLFKNRTTAALLTSVFLHGFAFTGGIYYMPLYFQAVHGASATAAGVELLPASALAGVTSVATGFIVTSTRDYRWTIWISWVIMTIGFGLLIDLGYPYDAIKCYVSLVVVGTGIGGIFLPPLIGLLAAMPTRDMAVATGCLVLLRLLGSATGIAVGGTIFNNEIASRLALMPQYILDNLTVPVQSLQDLPPELKVVVLTAYARSIRVIWIVLTPMSAVGLCLVLLVRKYTLKRNVVRAGKEISDTEKDGNLGSTENRQYSPEKANDLDQ